MVFRRIERTIEWAWYSSPGQRVITLGVLVALLLAGVLLYRPVLRSMQSWRAGKLLDQAQHHAAANDWNEVQRTARAALQLDPSLSALRLYVLASQHTRDPHRLHTALHLFRHPGATAGDRRDVLAAFLDANDLIAAAHLIKNLRKEDYDPNMKLQAVRFLVKADHLPEAGALADQEFAAGRGACDLVVAQGLARTGNANHRQDLSRRIQRLLGQPDNEQAVKALRLLSSLPDDWIHRELAREAVERFGDMDGLSVSDRLRVDLFRVALQIEPRDELIAARLNEYREQDLDSLLPWLNRLGETSRVVELTDGLTKPSVAIFQQRTNALAALARYQELAADLEDPPPGLSEVTVLALRASIAATRGLESDAVVLWGQAMERARRNRKKNEYYQIATMAHRAGDRTRQMTALAHALEHPMGLPPPVDEIKPLLLWLYEQGELNQLRRISHRLLEREPGNPLLVNMYHYLRIVRGERPAPSLPVLEQLVGGFPNELSFRSTLAFALLMNGEPERAQATMDAQDLEPADFPASEKAIYAAILHALNLTLESRTLSAQISWSALPEFEAKVFRRLLAQ